MRTIEDILAEAKKLGFMLHNLFDIPKGMETNESSGQWQANFRHRKGHYDYGRGGTPNDALEDALLRCKGLKGEANRPISRILKSAEEENELEGLL